MTQDLSALLIPPQEARLRSQFGLEGATLELITSGWHRLVVAASDRVFAFPRNELAVPMLEREADVLSTLELTIAPHLLGLHRDDSISPYPFLELTRLPGTSYDAVEDSLSFEDTATCLEDLSRRLAQLHQLSVPARFAVRPEFLDPPRISNDWTEPDLFPKTIHFAVESLGPYLADLPEDLWLATLTPVAALAPATVNGEVSDGQFLIDETRRVTGVVDRDGLHVGHPFLDLDFGVGGYRICRWNDRWPELRRRIWEAYASERGVPLPECRSAHLFWSVLDATTLLSSGNTDYRFGKALADLSEATGNLR